MGKLVMYPFDMREARVAGELDGTAYTYALIHVPTKHIYFSSTDAPRKVANMWAHRLRNPDGRQRGQVGVPRTWLAFPWVPEDWAIRFSAPYDTLQEARKWRDIAIQRHAETLPPGLQSRALNRPSTVRALKPKAYQPSYVLREYRPLDVPFDKPYEIRVLVEDGKWEKFLKWVLVLNRCPNPSDWQVANVWREYHRLRGRGAPTPVFDPDRAARHVMAERRRAYSRNAREVAKGLRPRTWANYQG